MKRVTVLLLMALSLLSLVMLAAFGGRDLVDNVAAFGTLIIALLVAYVAWEQWNINKNRLKHEKLAHKVKIKCELFDRRYAQFRAIEEFLGYILQTGMSTSADGNKKKKVKLYQATRGSVFLFPDEISQYIDEIITEAELYEYKIKERNAAVDSGAAERSADEADRLFAWFREQSKNLESRLIPYLRLEQDE